MLTHDDLLKRGYELVDTPARPEVAPARPADSRDGSLAFSVDQAQRMAGRGIQAVGNVLSLPSVEQFGRSTVEQQDKDIAAGGYQPQYPGGFLEQPGVGSKLGWVGEKVAENTATMAPSLLGLGATLAAPASVPLAAAITGATTAANFLMNTGETAGELDDKGVTNDKAALVGGAAKTALDYGGIKVVSAPLKAIGSRLAGKAAAEGSESVLKAAGKGFLGEGLTEGAQDTVDKAAAASQGATYTPGEVGSGFLDSALVGGVMGGAASGIGAGAGKLVKAPAANAQPASPASPAGMTDAEIATARASAQADATRAQETQAMRAGNAAAQENALVPYDEAGDWRRFSERPGPGQTADMGDRGARLEAPAGRTLEGEFTVDAPPPLRLTQDGAVRAGFDPVGRLSLPAGAPRQGGGGLDQPFPDPRFANREAPPVIGPLTAAVAAGGLAAPAPAPAAAPILGSNPSPAPTPGRDTMSAAPPGLPSAALGGLPSAALGDVSRSQQTAAPGQALEPGSTSAPQPAVPPDTTKGGESSPELRPDSARIPPDAESASPNPPESPPKAPRKPPKKGATPAAAPQGRSVSPVAGKVEGKPEATPGAGAVEATAASIGSHGSAPKAEVTPVGAMLRDAQHRHDNAVKSFVETAVEQRGLTEQEARDALSHFLRVKVAKIDFTMGVVRLKSGAFWDGDVLRRAAGLEQKRAKREGKAPATSAAPARREPSSAPAPAIPPQNPAAAPAGSVEQPAAPAKSANAPVTAETADAAGGKQQTVSTANGRKVETQFEAVPLSSLTDSSRPGFPAELQPRDRARRIGSDAQIAGIVANFDPELLNDSRLVSQGAPLVADDNVVESGNGRIAAIRAVYQKNDARAEAYRNMIAARGFDVAGMESPVLVRRRLTPLSMAERIELAHEANERSELGMSSAERGKADARFLTGDLMSRYHGGEMSSAANADFVRGFMKELSATEQGSLLTADGALSQDGIRRIETALLARAYADTDLLQTLTESTDSNIKNIGGALLDAAPDFAKLRGAIEAGAVPDALDIIEHVVGAARLVSAARRQGVALAELVGQEDMLSGGVPTLTRDVLQLMFRGPGLKVAASREAMATLLREYANGAMNVQAGDGLFSDMPQVTAGDIVKSLQEKAHAGARQAESQQALFGANPSRQGGGGRGEGAQRAVNAPTGGQDAAAGTRQAEPATVEPESPDVAGSRTDLERDRRNAESGDAVGAQGVQAGVAGNGGPARQGVPEPEGQGRPAADRSGDVDGQTLDVGGAGHHWLSDGSEPAGHDVSPADRGDAGGSHATGGAGIQPDADTSAAAVAVATAGTTQPADLTAKRAAQAAAQNVAVVPKDPDNIREALPFLTDGQRDDVLFSEQRFDKPDGYGVLFTNGTGTGKTYSSLGIVKRFERAGRTNILIVVPSQTLIDDYVAAGKNLLLDVKALAGTRDNGGSGPVITTYAAFGQNEVLAQRAWDLIVTDESQNLSQAVDGGTTNALEALRALALHPDGAGKRAKMLHPGLYEAAVEANRALHKNINPGMQAELQAQADQAHAAWGAALKQVEADVKAKQGAARPRVVMLSATPFAYRENIQYADGFLLDFKPVDTSAGYNAPKSGFNQFMVSNFGYRMRYGKLTKPESGVNVGLMETELNARLRRSGALSWRGLAVDADYDRKFLIAHNAVGTKIDEGHQFLTSTENWQRFGELSRVLKNRFNYLAQSQLLEAIKAKAAIPYIRASLDAGRKVVVFHNYNVGGAVHPFRLPEIDAREDTNDESTLMRQYRAFKEERPDLYNLDLNDLVSPIDTLTRAFPEALLFNGTVSSKTRTRNKALFNADDGQHRIIIVQSDAGGAGLSLHDTTGKFQRALVNLGLPVRPVTAIQQEGRIYRMGVMTDAIIRYMATGTIFERIAFAQKIAERSSTVENLAMGSAARDLKRAFIDAFQDARDEMPGPDDGKGGKTADRAIDRALTPFDKAKTHYFAQMKKTGRRDQREGFEYFPTPEPVGLKMVEWLHLKENEAALEPSAGHGAIARYLPETVRVTAIEPSADLASRLAMAMTGRVITGRFEDLHVSNKYDGIVMNPPFGSGGKLAIEHLARAATHLKSGGRIVAILPVGPSANKRFDQWYESDESKGFHLVADITMPPVLFERAGTNAQARVVIIDRSDNPAQQRTRDLSDAETIGKLFDRLQDMEMPERSPPVSKADARVKFADPDLEAARNKARGDARSSMDGAARALDEGDTEGAAALIERAQRQTESTDFHEASAGIPDAVRAMPTLDRLGIKVTQTVTAGGKAAWEVSGKTFEHKDAIKRAGGKWYGPKKVWTFYDGDPTEELSKALDAGPASDVARYSRVTSTPASTTPAGRGLPLAQAQRIAAAFARKLGLAPERIVVLGSASEIGAPEGYTTKGAYDPQAGTVYLFADALDGVDDARRVLLHEAVGHMGVRAAVGEGWAGVRRLLEQGRAADQGIADLFAQVRDEEDPGLSDDAVAEEVLGRAAERYGAAGPLHWRRILGAIRSALRRLGLVGDGYSLNEVVNLLAAGRRAVRADGAPATGGEPAYARQTKARGRIRRTVDELVSAAQSQSHWRDWYARHEQVLNDLFGNDATLFQRILSATSQATNVKGNVTLALKAYTQLLDGQPFTGFLPGVVKNLDRIRANEALSGAKISQYGKANEGDESAIAVDRHISMLLFNTTSPNAAQIEAAKTRIRTVADRLGWAPREIQAALWAFNQTRLGTDPSEVQSYDRLLETRADFIRELRAEYGRGEGGSFSARRGTGAGAEEGTSTEGPGDALRFSRARDVGRGISNYVRDAISSPRTFNALNRTVGTQFHKAWKSPEYARVYRSVQDFLSDAQTMAYRASAKAPTLLPKLDGIRDVMQHLYPRDAQGRHVTRKDVEAAASALFDGRIEDKRWTDEALQARGMTPAQIGLYKEARATVDASLDDVAAAVMAKLARLSGIGDRLIDEAQAKPSQAFNILSPYVDADTLEKMEKEQARIQQLKGNGYAPLSRFGDYFVRVTAPGDSGHVLFRAHFETRAEANRVARALRADAQYRDAGIETGVLPKQDSQAFAGLTPETLELFGDALGLNVGERKDAYQEYLKTAVTARSALKRLIHARKIAGYSTDLERVLASFVISNSRHASRAYHTSEMNEAWAAIPERMGDVRDEARSLIDYVQNPREEAAGVRSLLFAQFLGGSVASALTNMTQPIMMTYPYLSSIKGIGPVRAAALMGRAVKAITVGGGADLMAALKRAEADGTVAPQEIHQLYAEAIRSGVTNNRYIGRSLRAASVVWGSLFSVSEQINRRITFAAAYLAAQETNQADPFAFAESTVNSTQGVYNKGNRPNLGRGAVGATLMTFKQYSIAYVEFLRRLPPRERAMALGILVLAAGLQGLPGADDLDDGIDTLAQALGYNWRSQDAKRRFLHGVFGKALGDFLLYGMSTTGLPLDFQARLGLGNLIPGTAMFKRSSTDKSRDVMELAGPAGSVVQQWMRAWDVFTSTGIAEGALLRGGWEALQQVAPVAFGNALKAADMFSTGYAMDAKGKRVAPVTTGDAITKLIGFQPASLAAGQRNRAGAQESAALTRDEESRITEIWADGVFQHDRELVARAVNRMKDWNTKNPETPIRVTMQQIRSRVKEMGRTRDERLIRAAPRELRHGIRSSLSE